jgi:hypothetical protein
MRNTMLRMKLLIKVLCISLSIDKEVSDLLMGIVDGAKALIDASDRLILYIIINTYVPMHMVVQFLLLPSCTLFNFDL